MEREGKRLYKGKKCEGPCGVKKGIDDRIDEGVLRWFGHVESMEMDRIAKRVYVGEVAGSRSDG